MDPLLKICNTLHAFITMQGTDRQFSGMSYIHADAYGDYRINSPRREKKTIKNSINKRTSVIGLMQKNI